jgi:hypothetical protein
MKCTDFKQQYAEHDGCDLPSPAAQHLVECPDCQRFVEQDKTLRGLLRLKHYEQPPEETLNRCSAAIQQRIAEDHADNLIMWPGWARNPVLAVAALLLVLLGAGLVFLRMQSPTAPPLQLAQPAKTQAPRDMFDAAWPNAPLKLADDGLQWSACPPAHCFDQPAVTDSVPQRVQYGTRASSLVDFEF